MRGSGKRVGTGVGYRKPKAIANHDIICAIIKIVKGKITEIGGDMMDAPLSRSHVVVEGLVVTT